MIYSKETKESAAKMYLNGESTAKIKRDLGIECNADIYSFIDENCADLFRSERERRHLGEEEEKVLRMFDAGSKPADIVKETSVCLGTVYDWLKKHGRDLRRKTLIDNMSADAGKIKVLYWEKGKTLKEIAKDYGVSASTILKFFIKHDIPRRVCNQSLIQYNKITPSIRERIIGEILGDGSLSGRTGLSARYEHSTKHKGYIEWLSGLLAEGGIPQSGVLGFHEAQKLMVAGRIASFKPTWKYSSHALIALQELRDSFYPNGKKIVPLDIELTPLVCLHWYLGDGDLDSGTRIGVSTDAFSKDDHDVLISKLGELSIEAITREKRGVLVLRMSVAGTRKFLEYIGPCPAPIQDIYGYKWDLKEKWAGAHHFRRDALSKRTQEIYDAFIAREGG